MPPLRFIEMYLASAVEEEIKKSPKTVQEALEGLHGEKWQKAMDSEMQSLRENGVYEIVEGILLFAVRSSVPKLAPLWISPVTMCDSCLEPLRCDRYPYRSLAVEWST